MSEEKCHTKGLDSQSILNEVTNTLLYEGYSLFPYHRSAVKNQKPIPFGIVFPKMYAIYNKYFSAEMQAECIVRSKGNFGVEITCRFLHLLKSDGGWQTLERKIDSENVICPGLQIKMKKIPFQFGYEGENGILPINGNLTIKAEPVDGEDDIFKITVTVSNNSLVEQPQDLLRDEALCQSFLSTHVILRATNAEFVSTQNPSEDLIGVVTQCKNKGLWPVLIDAENTTMLCSPIIVYDHPKIHPQSKTDLFDSTEIEEALMLHFAAMSEAEKQDISNSDERLASMFNKVAEITAEELISLHGRMKEV